MTEDFRMDEKQGFSREKGQKIPAGLLFFRAGRTAFWQARLQEWCGRIGAEILEVEAAPDEEALLGRMDRMLSRFRLVFAVSGTVQGIPEAAEPVFRSLKLPREVLTEQRECPGVRWLSADTGWNCILKGEKQAIGLLADGGSSDRIEDALKPIFSRLAEMASVPLAPDPLQREAVPDFQSQAEELRFLLENGS